MGLDIQLTRRVIVDAGESSPDRVQADAVLVAAGFTPDECRDGFITVTVPAGRWHSAHSIWTWMTKELPALSEGLDVYTDPGMLDRLAALCESALAGDRKARSELPPFRQIGAPTGPQWYRSELERTVDIVRAALANDRGDLYLQGSW